MYSQDAYKWHRELGESMSKRWGMRRTPLAKDGFEDGKRPQAKEYRQPLEDGKGKGMNFPLEPLDFSPVRCILYIWPPAL